MAAIAAIEVSAATLHAPMRRRMNRVAEPPASDQSGNTRPRGERNTLTLRERDGNTLPSASEGGGPQGPPSDGNTQPNARDGDERSGASDGNERTGEPATTPSGSEREPHAIRVARAAPLRRAPTCYRSVTS